MRQTASKDPVLGVMLTAGIVSSMRSENAPTYSEGTLLPKHLSLW
jgi:hypothetical protein